MSRIQVLVAEEEREMFRRMAKREGVSLSAWLRKAGVEKAREARGRARIESAAHLRRFFSECRRREEVPEPEWDDHLLVMEESRSRGASRT